MLSRVSDVRNPCKLGTVIFKIIAKLFVIAIAFCVLSRMTFMPYPIMDVPCENGYVDSICSVLFRLKPVVGRDDDFCPKLVCRRNPEIDVFNLWSLGHSSRPK
jgi:hypothetical protein